MLGLVAAAVAAITVAMLAQRRGWSRRDTVWILAVSVASATVGGLAVPNLAILMGLIAAAAAIDARLEIIPNGLALATLSYTLILWAGYGDGWDLLIACAVEVLCIGLFFIGGFGAGDAKFLPVVLLAVITQSQAPLETLVWSQVFLVLVCVGMVVSYLVAGLTGHRSREHAMAPAIMVAAVGTPAIIGHVISIM